MSKLQYNGETYLLNESETALECLLRHNVVYPNSCQSGTCQSCLSLKKSGEMQPEWQKGLKPTLIAQDYFLPCICRPQGDLAMALPDQADVSIAANISELVYFNDNVLCVRLQPNESVPWQPGQYLNLVAPGDIVRSYSIANLAEKDGYIELHIKLMPGGLISQWLIDEAGPGVQVYLRGPMGNCFYCNPKKESFPMVLAGTGTGLAPLLGIVLDALEQGHQGDIFLIHGGVVEADLYLDERLEALASGSASFHYKKCTLKKSEHCPVMPIDELLLETLAGIAEKTQLFVCGPEETTKQLKTKAFLAGVPSAAIYSDAFLSTPTEK